MAENDGHDKKKKKKKPYTPSETTVNVLQNELHHGCPFRMKAKVRAAAFGVTRGQATLPLRPRPAFISLLWRPVIVGALTLNSLSPDAPLHTESCPPRAVRLAYTHP